MKPPLRDRVALLLRTDSETEFFMILLGSLAGELARDYDRDHGFGVKLSVKQNLVWLEGEREVIGRKTTDEFALYQDGTLSWARLGQPALTGLKVIQAVMAKHRGTVRALPGAGQD